jgi:hypothetical protein
MTFALLIKLLILVLLGLITLSLGSGLLFLVRDGGKTRRLITSLSVRVFLSIVLFLLLILGYVTGLIQPHGIATEQTETRKE